MRSGNTKSCGCQKIESAKKPRKRKHGLSGSKEYATYHKIIMRCHNPSNNSFDRYGGRGIVVCERWRSSFDNFLSDMGMAPSARHSIDRIDNDGPYSPENCRWATYEDQAQNTRLTSRVSDGHIEMSLTWWARHFNVSRSSLLSRINKGQNVRDAANDILRSPRRARMMAVLKR